MQVKCYLRNWHSPVCIPKCQFYNECSMHYQTVKLKKIKKQLKDR